ATGAMDDREDNVSDQQSGGANAQIPFRATAWSSEDGLCTAAGLKPRGQCGDDGSNCDEDLLGWATKSFCSWPQEIEVSLNGCFRVHEIVLCAHPFRIPTRVEFFVTGAREEAAYYLGHVLFDSNLTHKFECSEEKVIPLNVYGTGLRLRVAGCHRNPLNLFEQAQLTHLEVMGSSCPLLLPETPAPVPTREALEHGLYAASEPGGLLQTWKDRSRILAPRQRRSFQVVGEERVQGFAHGALSETDAALMSLGIPLELIGAVAHPNRVGKETGVLLGTLLSRIEALEENLGRKFDESQSQLVEHLGEVMNQALALGVEEQRCREQRTCLDANDKDEQNLDTRILSIADDIRALCQAAEVRFQQQDPDGSLELTARSLRFEADINYVVEAKVEDTNLEDKGTEETPQGEPVHELSTVANQDDVEEQAEVCQEKSGQQAEEKAGETVDDSDIDAWRRVPVNASASDPLEKRMQAFMISRGFDSSTPRGVESSWRLCKDLTDALGSSGMQCLDESKHEAVRVGALAVLESALTELTQAPACRLSAQTMLELGLRILDRSTTEGVIKAFVSLMKSWYQFDASHGAPHCEALLGDVICAECCTSSDEFVFCNLFELLTALSELKNPPLQPLVLASHLGAKLDQRPQPDPVKPRCMAVLKFVSEHLEPVSESSNFLDDSTWNNLTKDLCDKSRDDEMNADELALLRCT
ncbi:Centrosomal protein of 104 kDa (Cep104), partial [Durusdinium trenchii]